MEELYLLSIISFLSATLLPGGSETYLSWLVLTSNYSNLLLLLIASIGNSLGGFTNWLLGFCISHPKCFNLKLKKPHKKKRYLIAKIWIRKYGIYTLLLSWLPLIGDILCLIAGIAKLNWLKSLILILIGKTIRYTILIYTIDFF